MSRRDLAARMGGFVALGLSWGCCLWLRALTAQPGHQPSLLQALLVLASFVLTLVGLLLLLNGARLLRSPGPPQRSRTDALTRRALRVTRTRPAKR